MGIQILFDASAPGSDVFVYVMGTCSLTRRCSRAGVLEDLRMRAQADVAPCLSWGIYRCAGELVTALPLTNGHRLFASLVHF